MHDVPARGISAPKQLARMACVLYAHHTPQNVHAGCLAAAAALVQLLGGILDVNASYVCVVDELGLSQSFFDFLTLDHPNNNVHNIRLCRQLVLSGCISTQQLLQLRATDKVIWDRACSNVMPAGLPGRRLLGAEPLGSGAGAACPRHV